MKKIITIIALIAATIISVSAQSMSVESFQMLESDLTARVIEPQVDQNGKKAALIKIVTAQTGFSFDGGVAGVVDFKQKNGEVWLYLPEGCKYISIMHQELGVLRNYHFPISLKSATTYEMILQTADANQAIDNSNNLQYLTINYTPKELDVDIYIDSTNYYLGSNGSISVLLDQGEHTYRVEAANRSTVRGSVTIINEQQELNLELKSLCGIATISTVPEGGAEVFLNGVLLGTTPFTTNEMLKGDYEVVIKSQYYLPTKLNFTIAEHQETIQEVELTPNFSNITLKCAEGTELFINNQFKGADSVTVRLVPGTYIFEARKDTYRPYRISQVVQSQNNQTVVLQEPSVKANGSIEIQSNVPSAIITLDSVNYGTTPNILSGIPTGKHTLTLDREGYRQYQCIVEVFEGETRTHIAQLEKLPMQEVNFNKAPINSVVLSPMGGTNNSNQEQDKYSDIPELVLERNKFYKGVVDCSIPDSVTIIGEEAFKNCFMIKNLTIPASVREIRNDAFAGCDGITNLKLPNSVVSIGDRAFADCDALVTLHLPSSLKSIGDDAFNACTALASAFFPKQLETIGNGAFEDCDALTSITLPESCKKVGDDAFRNCAALISVNFSSAIDSIGASAFRNCSKLKQVVLPDSLRSVEAYTFYDCDELVLVKIGDRVTYIKEKAFKKCVKIGYIAIPNSVKVIENEAFASCSNLVSVSIAESVNCIGNYAFLDCINLSAITIPNPDTIVGRDIFLNCPKLTTIRVPASSKVYRDLKRQYSTLVVPY